MLKRLFILLILILFPAGFVSLKGETESSHPDESQCSRLYFDMGLERLIDYNAFERALDGFYNIKHKNEDIFTIIDFTKPSDKERLFVLDIVRRKILFHSYVSHGRNSGENYATQFSNVSGSYKSSLGFYLTENTYIGSNGYSLIINGLEREINDKAKQRAIVIHGADYCDASFVNLNGRLGRSFGCPALPMALSRKIIDAIKDGSLLYIYANDPLYLSQSTILSGKTKEII